MKYGGITDLADLKANLRTHCWPESLLDGEIPIYEDFLEERRQLMALKIKRCPKCCNGFLVPWRSRQSRRNPIHIP
jgi:hypothetical protein